MHFLGNSREVDTAEAIQHTPVLFWLFPCEAVLHHHLCRSQENDCCVLLLHSPYHWHVSKVQTGFTCARSNWNNAEVAETPQSHTLNASVQAFNPRSFLFWRIPQIFIWQLNSITDITSSHNWMLQNELHVFSTCFCFWPKKWACPSTAHVKCNPHPI